MPSSPDAVWCRITARRERYSAGQVMRLSSAPQAARDRAGGRSALPLRWAVVNSRAVGPGRESMHTRRRFLSNRGVPSAPTCSATRNCSVSPRPNSRSDVRKSCLPGSSSASASTCQSPQVRPSGLVLTSKARDVPGGVSAYQVRPRATKGNGTVTGWEVYSPSVTPSASVKAPSPISTTQVFSNVPSIQSLVVEQVTLCTFAPPGGVGKGVGVGVERSGSVTTGPVKAPTTGTVEMCP